MGFDFIFFVWIVFQRISKIKFEFLVRVGRNQQQKDWPIFFDKPRVISYTFLFQTQ